MLNYEHFAVTLARAIELFRTEPNAIPEQKTALRALVALTKLGGAALRVEGGRLVVEGVVIPPTLPGVSSLAERLAQLGVRQIRFARNASPAELLKLLRTLAQEPADGIGPLMVGSPESIAVLSVEPEQRPAAGKPMRVTEAFVAAGLVEETEAAQVAPEVSGTPEEGRDALVTRLLEATTIDQRLGRFEALRRADGGLEQILELLEGDDPAVVENIAELVGELRLPEALDRLGALLERPESGVRRAAAGALARIDGPEAVDFVVRVLKGLGRDERLAVARAAHAAAEHLAQPLGAAAQSEKDIGLKCAYYHALGRIGTPEALQLLIQAAQPGGRFLGRKRPEPRIAAIEGLERIGGPVAMGALEWLEQESNREVRSAARRALKELRQPGGPAIEE
ncbi:MAG: HEAT repeat domain-containing protein [Gemmatimonadales bacterium]